MIRAVVLASCLASCFGLACTRDEAKGAAPASSTSAAASASATAAHAPAAASAAGPSTWAGKYTATAGPFHVPEGGEWTGVKWRGDDAGTGLGEGALKVTVGPDGRAHGAVDGPLGPLRVDGELRDAVLSATLTPPDPATGFTGMLIGKVDGGKIAGTMRASLPTANVIREASFALENSATH